jgi:hypothetical protein
LAAVDSLHLGQKVVETPDMKVEYEGPRESMYWRE